MFLVLDVRSKDLYDGCMARIILLVFLGACEGWQRADTVRELAFATEQSVDWYQTSWITRNCDETNPIMGRCGQRVSPSIYFPVATVLHAAMSAALPAEWRHGWQYFSGGSEGTIVWMNFANRYERK
jgi:hypothetical protein